MSAILKLTAPATALLFASLASAQTPVLQLDGSNASSLALTGSHVDGWTSTPGGQTFTPLNGSTTAPTYVPNAINGHGAVSFDGTNPLIDNAFGSASYSHLTFVLVVAPRSNTGAYRAFLSDRTGDNNDYQTGFNIDQTSGGSSSFDRLNVEGVKGGGNGGVSFGTSPSPFGDFRLVSITYTSPQTDVYVDGSLAGSRDGNTNAVALTDLVVGGRYYKNSATGNYDGFLDGEIAEIRIYDGALSDTDRQGIESELNAKYFNPVPEPTALAALGLGALALLRRRRR